MVSSPDPGDLPGSDQNQVVLMVSALFQSGFLLDLTRISERLTCRALPGFQRVEDLVSELWTLMEDSSQVPRTRGSFGSRFCSS